jgi:DNA polymerase I
VEVRSVEMVLTVDFLDDGVPLVWSLAGTAESPECRVTSREDYQPTLYAVPRHGMVTAEPDPEACLTALQRLRDTLAEHPAVVEQGVEYRQPGYRFAEQPVLRVAVDQTRRVRSIAEYIEQRGPPGQVPFRTFDVDFVPEFRLCLDENLSPRPEREPTVLGLGLSREGAAAEDLSRLRLGTETTTGPDAVAEATERLEPVDGDEQSVLATLRDRLATLDPDVLVVERGEIIPLVADRAVELDHDFGLQRVPKGYDAEDVPAYQQLAGDSTFESYGQRHHSPARYNVPGRVLLDLSNTFFLEETNLAGCLDLVERSGKPLQELSWASIGNVLTAIQIREARRRDVLVQWRAWRPERFKSARQLHAGDRGGTTLSPDVGLHEEVYELDFASLYPNIICQHNLSPETVRCRCCDSAGVPGLDYSVCDREGVLPEVLQPIIDDRAEMKRRLRGDDLSATERDRFSGQASALKWILVSCFGYQGFSNAKFGRIEVHEAINAHARDILLTAKDRLEAGGWRVLHGIVDSVWVTPRGGVEQESLEEVAASVSEEIGIELEYESAFEWVAFCALRDGEAGALTRYFGRRRDPDPEEERYKMRGIECRQRSTPAWVADVQRDLIETLDETQNPDAVIARLRDYLDTLAAGDVNPENLLVRQRATKAVEEYTRRTRTVAALERAVAEGLNHCPGEDVRFAIVDDTAESANRVRLLQEIDPGTRYDSGFYRELAIQATTSVLSPFGWSVDQVRTAIESGQDVPLASY